MRPSFSTKSLRTFAFSVEGNNVVADADVVDAVAELLATAVGGDESLGTPRALLVAEFLVRRHARIDAPVGAVGVGHDQHVGARRRVVVRETLLDRHDSADAFLHLGVLVESAPHVEPVEVGMLDERERGVPRVSGNSIGERTETDVVEIRRLQRMRPLVDRVVEALPVAAACARDKHGTGAAADLASGIGRRRSDHVEVGIGHDALVVEVADAARILVANHVIAV